jgi:DNA-binding transcriptional LysR family regulator
MTITPAGRSYYERCLRVLREVEGAQAVARGEAFDGPLNVTAPVTFGLARVVPHMHGLMAKHPGLRIDLFLEDRLIDLALEGVDIAVRVGQAPPDSTELVAHRLFSFRRVLVASAEYLKRKGEPKTPEGLVKHDCLTYPAGQATDLWTLASDEREARVRVNVGFRCNALHALRELAVSGSGIALLPDWLVAEEVKRRALRIVLPAWQTAPVSVNALHRTEHRGTLRVRAFVDHMRAAYEPQQTRK